MNKKYSLFPLLFIFSFAQTQSIQLVKDIALPDSQGSDIRNMVKVNDSTAVFFANQKDGNGWGLWQTDGTELGTTLISNLNGSPDGNPVFYDNNYLWLENSGLWKDAPGLEPILIKDIGAAVSGRRDLLVPLNGKLYWFTNSGIVETDGTEQGTKMLIDKTIFDYPQHLDMIKVKDEIYFVGRDYSGDNQDHKMDIWKTDGVVHELDRKVMGSGAELVCSLGNIELLDYEGQFGYAFSGHNGRCQYHHFYFTEGSGLLDHNSSPNLSSLIQAPIFKDSLLFYIKPLNPFGHTKRYNLFSFDGIEEKAIKEVENENWGWAVNETYKLQDGNLLILTTNGIWFSDGTMDETERLKWFGNTDGTDNTIGTGTFTAAGEFILFAEEGDVTVFWKTDGTVSGTVKLADFTSTLKFEDQIDEVIRLGDKILFAGNDGILGRELWALDLNGISSVKRVVDSQSFTIQKAYPNPFSNQFTVEVLADRFSAAQLEVFNIFGQRVLKKNVNLTEGLNTIPVNLDSDGSGILMVKMTPFHPYLRQIRVMRVRD